jgi:hypothetical protein
MAERLATEYVKTSLQLKEAEMPKFFNLFEEQRVQMRVTVLGSGGHEIVMTDGTNEEVVLSMERSTDQTVRLGPCRIASWQMANALRKAISLFKGDAVAHRIYRHCTMVYVYERGKVVKISEVRQGHCQTVYEYRDTVGQLERMYRKDDVEREIGKVRSQIDELLDLRNGSGEPAMDKQIDERLSGLTHKLFVLEA